MITRFLEWYRQAKNDKKFILAVSLLFAAASIQRTVEYFITKYANKLVEAVLAGVASEAVILVGSAAIIITQREKFRKSLHGKATDYDNLGLLVGSSLFVSGAVAQIGVALLASNAIGGNDWIYTSMSIAVQLGQILTLVVLYCLDLGTFTEEEQDDVNQTRVQQALKDQRLQDELLREQQVQARREREEEQRVLREMEQKEAERVKTLEKYTRETPECPYCRDRYPRKNINRHTKTCFKRPDALRIDEL